MDGADLSFEQHGAARHDRAALSLCGAIEDVLAGVAAGRAGTRLYGQAGLAALLTGNGSVGGIACDRLGVGARPVRAILFDKSPGMNWALGWHQDRTVAVVERHDMLGWGPWSTKAGVPHVEPPFALMERMVTLRIHLDPVPADNAPLLVAPGSHRLGRIAERDIAAVIERCGIAVCLADRGDVWTYATPIVHASAASSGHAHRRVLQVDYAAISLPPPLAWRGM
jgi:hypothetical protein